MTWILFAKYNRQHRIIFKFSLLQFGPFGVFIYMDYKILYNSSEFPWNFWEFSSPDFLINFCQIWQEGKVWSILISRGWDIGASAAKKFYYGDLFRSITNVPHHWFRSQVELAEKPKVELADEPKKAPGYIQTPKPHTIIGEGGRGFGYWLGPRKQTRPPSQDPHFRNLARSSLPQVHTPWTPPPVPQATSYDLVLYRVATKYVNTRH